MSRQSPPVACQFANVLSGSDFHARYATRKCLWKHSHRGRQSSPFHAILVHSKWRRTKCSGLIPGYRPKCAVIQFHIESGKIQGVDLKPGNSGNVSWTRPAIDLAIALAVTHSFSSLRKLTCASGSSLAMSKFLPEQKWHPGGISLHLHHSDCHVQSFR